MPLSLRRVVFWAFISLFLIIAPILALYSMGYRYHWGKHRIERTGLIVVNGEPQDASVRIDGVIRASRLPARIGGLGENDYTIRIEREGFHPWEQRVVVTSGRTALVTDVVLFRSTLPALALDGTIAHADTSADGEWLAFTRKLNSFEELWIVDLATTERTIALRTPHVPLTFSWSPRGAALLVTTTSDALVIDPRNAQRPRSLTNILRRQPTAIAWELGSATALIASGDGRVVRISLLTGRAVTLSVPAPTGAFAIARGSLIASADHTITITPIDGGAPKTIAVGDAAITDFIDLKGSLLTAETRDAILDIELTAGNVRTRAGHGLNWDARHEVAIWDGNPFELWMESDDPPQPRLLARRDIPIVDAAWYPKEPYILIATTHDVTAINRNAPARAPVTLALFDDLRAVAVAQRGAALLLIGRHGTTEGLWTLPLR